MTPEAPLAGPALEAQLAAIVQAADVAIISVDVRGRIVSWNPMAERLYGYAPGEVTGEPFELLYGAAHGEADTALLARAQAGEVGSFETVRATRSGECVPVASTASPMLADGRVVGVAFVERDISDRLHLEREREALIAELRRSNGDLEQFAYVASHDLSEPLRVVAGMVTLLADRYEEDLDDRAQDYIRRTVAATARMRALIDDLLVYSRAGRARIERERIDTAALVEETIRALAEQVLDREAEIAVGPLPAVHADPRLLGQVLQNLISNALKFSEDRPAVEVSGTQDDDGARISVADRGIGIAPEHTERVTMLFKRLHTRSEFAGNGLGLAISRRIVEGHGGTLEISPRAGGGTVVSFTLPTSTHELPEIA